MNAIFIQMHSDVHLAMHCWPIVWGYVECHANDVWNIGFIGLTWTRPALWASLSIAKLEAWLTKPLANFLTTSFSGRLLLNLNIQYCDILFGRPNSTDSSSSLILDSLYFLSNTLWISSFCPALMEKWLLQQGFPSRIFQEYILCYYFTMASWCLPISSMVVLLLRHDSSRI